MRKRIIEEKMEGNIKGRENIFKEEKEKIEDVEIEKENIENGREEDIGKIDRWKWILKSGGEVLKKEERIWEGIVKMVLKLERSIERIEVKEKEKGKKKWGKGNRIMKDVRNNDGEEVEIEKKEWMEKWGKRKRMVVKLIVGNIIENEGKGRDVGEMKERGGNNIDDGGWRDKVDIVRKKWRIGFKKDILKRRYGLESRWKFWGIERGWDLKSKIFWNVL